MLSRRISLSNVGRQNIVYSDAEQTEITNALKTTEAGLLRLGTLRSNAPARRRQLKDQIRRCQAALRPAPFKKIPKEIWMYIFELYCQSCRLSTCVKRPPPVVITHVCSEWRQIALSMSKLWSDVQLGKSINLARIWLGRAGSIPRALESSTTRNYSFIRSMTIQSFVCSFPFRKLHITQNDALGMGFAAIPVESLLLLEDLALLKPASDSPNFAVPYFSSHHFPNLVSLHIGTDAMPHFHVSRPFATWKKLRVLRLECVLDAAKYVEILRDAPSLEDCSFHLRVTHGQFLTIKNAVVANLKILTISFSLTSALQSFMDHLTFPNLHTLILIPRRFIYDTSLLPYLVSRIGSLKSLNIHQFYVNVDVGLLLECLPLLQVLELHCNDITTDIAEKIGRGELGGCLRELRDWNQCNLIKLLQACELRRDVTRGSHNSSGAIASLEKVSVRRSNSVADCRWRIRKLHKDGIHFQTFEVSRKVRST